MAVVFFPPLFRVRVSYFMFFQALTDTYPGNGNYIKNMCKVNTCVVKCMLSFVFLIIFMGNALGMRQEKGLGIPRGKTADSRVILSYQVSS